MGRRCAKSPQLRQAQSNHSAKYISGDVTRLFTVSTGQDNLQKRCQSFAAKLEIIGIVLDRRAVPRETDQWEQLLETLLISFSVIRHQTIT